MTQTPPPRLHVIPARSAPVAAVLARGPSSWFQVLRWELDAGLVEPGAWIHATIYPRRCDISPDGRLLCSFILASRPPPFDSYFAVSRLPWLTALAAWRVGSTYAAACQFHPDGTLALGFPPETPPDHGSYPGRLGSLTPHPPGGRDVWATAAVVHELRRGWRIVGEDDAREAVAVTPAAGAAIVIERDRPSGEFALELVHAGHDHRGGWVEGAEVHYVVRAGERRALAEGVTWADWDAAGRLLVATADGAIEVREDSTGGWRPVWRHDLRGRTPEPGAAPDWACHW
jgi:hypothetical protein